MNIPTEILQIISNYCNVQTKFNIRMACKYNYSNIWICTFYDELCFKYLKLIEYPNISHKLGNKILGEHKYITELNIKNNNKIFDNDIKHLKYLHALYVNGNITNEGIKCMNLHTLDITVNKHIYNIWNFLWSYNTYYDTYVGWFYNFKSVHK